MVKVRNKSNMLGYLDTALHSIPWVGSLNTCDLYFSYTIKIQKHPSSYGVLFKTLDLTLCKAQQVNEANAKLSLMLSSGELTYGG